MRIQAGLRLCSRPGWVIEKRDPIWQTIHLSVVAQPEQMQCEAVFGFCIMWPIEPVHFMSRWE